MPKIVKNVIFRQKAVPRNGFFVDLCRVRDASCSWAMCGGLRRDSQHSRAQTGQGMHGIFVPLSVHRFEYSHSHVSSLTIGLWKRDDYGNCWDFHFSKSMPSARTSYWETAIWGFRKIATTVSASYPSTLFLLISIVFSKVRDFHTFRTALSR